MIEHGILGTRANLVTDVVMLALLIILPLMIYSYRQVRRGHYEQHRNWQLRLGVVLGIAVVLFEIDMQLSGGIYEMAKGGSYYGSQLLDTTLYIHLFFSVSTTLIWLFLLLISLKRFQNPPQPNSFSRQHRLWGRLGMMDMMMTAITGYILYWVAFVA